MLARLQTDIVLNVLIPRLPQRKFEIVTVKTRGDKILDRPIAEVGDRGVFVKELEESLLSGAVDFVVHSLKDLPTELPAELTLAAVLNRADPRDVLVSREAVTFCNLPAGARVATSSRRRAAQLMTRRKDLKFIDIRGNIQTRLRKLDEGECDAMVLAAAGLIRLELTDRIAEYFEPEFCTPAVSQGVLGIECRSTDQSILSMLKQIEDQPVRALITAERAFLHELGGGCSVPVGALATSLPDSILRLSGCIAALDGSKVYRASLTGPQNVADKLGTELAKQMLSTEAKTVIDSLKQTASNTVSPP
jgi:hydroxymethylbilane synthase